MSNKAEETAMKSMDERGLVPKLRFPEFRDAGEWVEKKLGDISKIVRGGSPRPIESYLTTDEKGLNWLKIGDVSQEAKYILSTKEKVRFEALKKTREVNPKDLILSNSMSFGRPYILKIKTCIHDGWIAISQIDDVVNVDYLYYFILSPFSQTYFTNNAAGSGVQNLNAEIIKLLPASVPKPSEQTKIADCLSSIDDLITQEAQELDALKTHKIALMQQLFPIEGETLPKLRFPEFRDAGEWEMEHFGKLFTIGNGKDFKHLSSGEVPVYGSGGYMLSVNDYLYDGESVCIGRKGTINKPLFVTGKFWTVDTLFYTHSFNNCVPRFVFLLFQNIDWLAHNEAGGIPSLSKTNIAKIKCVVPQLKEQQKIADCLSSLDELITAQAQSLDALKTHKKGLMQQLFPALDECSENTLPV